MALMLFSTHRNILVPHTGQMPSRGRVLIAPVPSRSSLDCCLRNTSVMLSLPGYHGAQETSTLCGVCVLNRLRFSLRVYWTVQEKVCEKIVCQEWLLIK